MATFTYGVTVSWTGDRGTGTSAYADYGRDHTIDRDPAPSIPGSSDPAFRGDHERWSPEDLFLASISACHKLWYLHLCAVNGVVVRGYVDRATGTMTTSADGSGKFTSVTLRPVIDVAKGSIVRAYVLHEEAHKLCFIANSVDVPILIEADIRAMPGHD